MFRYSEKKLARDIARAVKRIDPGFESVYDAPARSIDIHRAEEPDAPPYQVFLGNIFLKVRDMGRRERVAMIDAFLHESLVPRERTPDELLASLALRARTPFELNLRRHRIALRHEPPEPVVFGDGDLVLELVADSEEMVATVSPEALAETGTSPDEAYTMAAARLARATGLDQWRELVTGVWVSTYEDDYDFARLVAAGSDARLPVDGPPVVFAPSHSVCLITDRDDEETLRRMVEIGGELADSHRPLSQLLWRPDPASGWAIWLPDPAHEGASVARLQWTLERIGQYAEQKEYLEILLEARDEDSFVATFQAFGHEGGIRTLATYTLDVPTYLPRTDVVALVDPEAEGDVSVLGCVAWADLEDVLGADMPGALDGMIPAVHPLMQPISADQAATLRERAVPL